MKRRTLQQVSKATGLSVDAVRVVARQHPDASADALVSIIEEQLREQAKANVAKGAEVLRRRG